MKKQFNICGLLSLLFSLTGLLFAGIPCGIAAIALGSCGFAKVKDGQGVVMAMFGFIIGVVDVAVVVSMLAIT